MINLLPTEVKRDIRAARMNVILLRYNMLTLGGVVLLALFCLLFYVILHNQQAVAAATNSDNTAKAASYATVQQQADQYRQNLSIAKQIFANSVNYTDIINSITTLIPHGVILTNLNLSQATFNQQTVFTAQAKTYDDAIALKQSFQSSKLFSNVYLQSVSSTPGGGGTEDYPVSVTISAKFNKTGAASS